MCKFIRDACLFVAINVAILVLLYYRYGISDDYLAAANDKLNLLETV